MTHREKFPCVLITRPPSCTRLPISSCTIEQIIGGGWSSAVILFVLARVPDLEISFHQRH